MRTMIAALLLVLVCGPQAEAHIPEECEPELSHSVRLADGKTKVGGWIVKEIDTFKDIDNIFSLMRTYMTTDTLFMEQSERIIECIKSHDDTAKSEQ